MFEVMLVGRIIFGFTGDAIGVAESTIVALWFCGSELNFAFGLCRSTARIGSIFNSYTVPWIYDNYGLGMLCFSSAMVCLFSLINSIISYFVHVYAYKDP